MHAWLAAWIITSRCGIRITPDCLLLSGCFSRCAARFRALELGFSLTPAGFLFLKLFLLLDLTSLIPLFLSLCFVTKNTLLGKCLKRRQKLSIGIIACRGKSISECQQLAESSLVSNFYCRFFLSPQPVEFCG